MKSLKGIREENIWQTRETRGGLQFVAANLVAPSSCLLSGKKSWCTKNSKFNVPTSYPRLSSTISKVHKHMHQLFKIYTSFYHAKSIKVPNYCQHLLKEWTQIEQGRKL